MKAAGEFALQLGSLSEQVSRIEVTLYGSLAYTGKGHGTDSAVILGLMGLTPETINPDDVENILRKVHRDKLIEVPAIGQIVFDPEADLKFDFGEELPRHTNGMRFVASSVPGDVLCEQKFYSLGGGFIVRDDEPEATSQDGEPLHFFNSGDSLLKVAAENGLSIAELVYQNERQWRSADRR